MEEVYVPSTAEIPVDVDEGHLPDQVSAEAAFGLREILKTESQQHVAENMESSPRSVGAMVDSLEKADILHTKGGRGRGKEYHITEKGAEALWCLRNGIRSAEEDGEFLPEGMRSFENYSRHYELEPQDLAVFLYTIGYENIDEIEENTSLDSLEILDSRDNLEPFLDDGGKYVNNYSLNDKGRALLSHMYALDSNNNLLEDSSDEDVEETLSWNDY